MIDDDPDYLDAEDLDELLDELDDDEDEDEDTLEEFEPWFDNAGTGGRDSLVYLIGWDA